MMYGLWARTIPTARIIRQPTTPVRTKAIACLRASPLLRTQ